MNWLVALSIFTWAGFGNSQSTSPSCRPSVIGRRRGLCNASAGIAFYHLATLPSGGGTAEVKVAATIPGSTEAASFFFGLGTTTVAGITPTGTAGEPASPGIGYLHSASASLRAQ